MIIEQGYAMNKPSEILVSLAIEEKQITGVKVGGSALNLSSFEISL
jgi:predicted PhzF superfamily epimerase YddE/YHI9